jgi:ornithine cyclodeaminase/alanine dehydrogenase
LTRSDIRSLLRFDEYVEIVEDAFRLYAEGKTLKPASMLVDSVGGEFHVKAGGLRLDKWFFGLKVNGGFFHNMERFGMANIQGAILLCEGETGYPLAVMDSGEITTKRTGAAAAIAAKYLARPDSSVVTICGCGTQGLIQLCAMKSVLPFKKAYVFDVDEKKAQSFAREMSAQLAVPIVPTSSLGDTTKQSDVYVTCTPSRQFYLTSQDVSAGTFIAAMGADSPDKQELDPELLKSNKVVVDLLDQCSQAGELHHAIEQGMAKEDVYGELSEIITGKKPGRTSEEEITIFDATGTALQDVAAASAVYQRALHLGIGQELDLFK